MGNLFHYVQNTHFLEQNLILSKETSHVPVRLWLEKVTRIAEEDGKPLLPAWQNSH